MGRVLLETSLTSLDQLLHTISIAHEYSSGSPNMSFEEQTLNVQTKSSQPLEKSNREEEDMQDDLDLTSVKTPSIKEIDFEVTTSVVGGKSNDESCISPDITNSLILKPLAEASNGEQTPAIVTQEMQHSVRLYEPSSVKEDVKSVCKETTSENKSATLIKKNKSGSPHSDKMDGTTESRNKGGRPCKETKTMKNVSELGTSPKERMVEAMSNVSKRGRPRKDRFSETIKNWNKKGRTHKGKNSETMNNIKKEGEAPKEMAAGAMEEEIGMIEYPEKQQLNNTGNSSSIKKRGRPPKKRMTENKVDEEVVRNTFKRHVKKKGRPAKVGRPVKVRRTTDNKASPNGVGKHKNEQHLAVANKRLLINQTDRVGQQYDEFSVTSNKRLRINQTDEFGQENRELSALANKRLLLNQTDEVGQQNNEFSAVANKRLLLSNTDEIGQQNGEFSDVVNKSLLFNQTDEVGQQSNEFSDVANKSLLLSNTDDNKSSEKNSTPQTETETPESLNPTPQTENETPHTELSPLKVCRNTRLPFTKSSPLWEALESSQVLTTMPQRPHFLPLKQYSQPYREGMAIGLTVTFTNVVHTVKSLSISDPDESIELMMETLTDLERYGFNLYNLSDTLQSVGNLKEDHKRLTDKISVTNELILGRRSREEILNEKLEVIRESIVGLEKTNKSLHDEKMALAGQMEEFDRQMLKLRGDMKEVEESFLLAKSSLGCGQGSV